jgi:hypothetical protein
MTTDTALGVTKMVVQDKGKIFSNILDNACLIHHSLTVPLDKISFIVGIMISLLGRHPACSQP